MYFYHKISIISVVSLAIGSGVAAQSPLSDAEYEASTNSILSALGVAPETDAETEAEDFKAALLALVGDAIAEGKSGDYISALMQEASDDGSLIVPDAMLNTEGEIDIELLLQAAINAAIESEADDDVTEFEAALEAEAASGDAVVAPTPPEPEVVADLEYTVRPGDTLSRIANKFYNDSFAYPRILKANSGSISNANQIRVGQVLRIPQ
ncbi:MAG: LysM peptidoglycan-binding domain-containing protein [Paracoccaceae bacterium]